MLSLKVKVFSVVVWGISDYLEEAEKQLIDSNSYQEVNCQSSISLIWL